MSDKEKIEEMAEVIKTELAIEFGGGDTVEPEDFPCQAEHIAEALIAADYCKRSEAVKEVLEKIKVDICNTSCCGYLDEIKESDAIAYIDKLVAEYGAEVGK